MERRDRTVGEHVWRVLHFDRIDESTSAERPRARWDFGVRSRGSRALPRVHTAPAASPVCWAQQDIESRHSRIAARLRAAGLGTASAFVRLPLAGNRCGFSVPVADPDPTAPN